MCGRFTLTLEADALQQAFPQYAIPHQTRPRFNIAPGQPVLAVPNTPALQADFFVWGLIPSWSRDPSIGARLINARAETLAEKPSFRGPYRYRRCLLLADGFYEWKTVPGAKARPLFHPPEVRPALHLCWPVGRVARPGWLAGALLRHRHHRAECADGRAARTDAGHPAACGAGSLADPAPCRPERLQPLLVPYPAEEMSAHPVSTLVNRPENDRPELIQPL